LEVKDKLIFRIAASLGLFAMIIGSMGAHGIKFQDDYYHKLFDTGLLYLFIHIPVLMLLGVLGMRKEALLLTAGVCGFSLPLIVKGITTHGGGILVPIAGMLMIAAWLWIIISAGARAEKKKESE
jgi:uncharacterized membrane protein YgdD (TMEM256/DUF423 family)